VGVSLVFDGGRGRQMADLSALARHADDAGLASFWLPEHVVFVDGATSQYPYGELRLGRRPGTYDPIVALTVAAAATTSIRLGTSVLILPLRNPVVLAQQAVALDHASDGRLSLGIGVGWLREEMDAVGVPWERRGDRTDDYVAAMRALWRDDLAAHQGEFVRFENVLAWPKPVQQPGVPIYVGGNPPAALRRAARLGDGWFGWALDAAEVATALNDLDHELHLQQRARAELKTIIGVAWPRPLEDLRDYADNLSSLGVDELVVAVLDGRTDPRERLDGLAELARTLG